MQKAILNSIKISKRRNQMKKKVLKPILVVLLAVFILSAWSGQAYARLVYNQVDGCFDDTGRPAIRTHTIEAAGYFLKAYSEILALSDRIEMSDLRGIDYHESRLLVDRAIFNLENAREKYLVLNQIAANTPYNPGVINNLLIFNYREFRENQQLKGLQFDQAKSFLMNGDVRGIFDKALADVENILEKLDRVKIAIYSLSLPEMSDIWELNRLCSEFMLFGQYSARIFYRVTGK